MPTLLGRRAISKVGRTSMKIILSRKGFDSGYGGIASPVLPDGTLLSLPIPTTEKGVTYDELLCSVGQSYQDVIKQLTKSSIKVEGEGIFPIAELSCHLDPDVRYETYPRKSGWKGIFGQAGSALSHLENNGVNVGDVFLFFGWFRKTIIENDQLKYDPTCKGFHAIYGYLQIDKIEKIKETIFDEWAEYHPHVRRGEEAKPLDAVYISSETLSCLPEYKGYGTFNYSEKIVLTKEGQTRSRWLLPEHFRNYKISYHSENSWKNDYFQSAAKGQEFVIDGDENLQDWLKSLFL